MNEGIGRHLGRIARARVIEAPMVATVNQQVRTSMSVPFQPHMLGEMISVGERPIEAPSVTRIDQQVRTSMSVPFQSYMKDRTTAPAVDTVNQQVRTSMSVPFQPHMRGETCDAPAADPINQQVRTSMSVPFATYMRGAGSRPTVAAVDQQVRTSMSVPFNPYMLGAHAEELLKRRIMISPVLSVWHYQVKNHEAFAAWLATREILLSESRIGGDAEIRGVRYGGTYRVGVDRGETGGTYKTVWGYTSESAMLTMQKLCSDSSASATIVQLDLIDFVKGMKKFIAEAGDKHFAEELLVSAAAG